MDPIVQQAMLKWPNVPAVFGWLSLTARGEFLLKGGSIGNTALREFIARNYAGDQVGNWFFQNGPQRVYVTLALAPYVYQIDSDSQLVAHTGERPRQVLRVWADENARLFMLTDIGPGAIDDRDTGAFARGLVNAEACVLDDESVERWCAAELDGFLDASCFGVAQLKPLAIMRVHARELPTLLNYVQQPNSESVQR